MLATKATNGQTISLGVTDNSPQSIKTRPIGLGLRQPPEASLRIHPVDRPHASPPRFRAVCGFTGELLSPELFEWEALLLSQAFSSWEGPIDPVSWSRAASFICDGVTA